MSQSRTPEEIEAEILAQRAQLADTVQELSARLDVKSQARARVAGLKDAATTNQGSPRPEVLAVAGAVLVLAVVVLVRRRRSH